MGSATSNETDSIFGSTTSSDSPADEYGFFDIDTEPIRELETLATKNPTPTSRHTDSYNQADSRQYFPEISKKSVSANDPKVIFTFNIKCASLSCKSFESLSGLTKVQVSSSVTGFRIVQDPSGESVQFRIMLCVDNKRYEAWRKLADFATLVQATKVVYSKNGDVKNAFRIWEEITAKLFWRRRNFSVRYLTWQSLRLGDFLKEFLFEIPVHHVLQAFVLED